jgi:hypothetical protein
MKKTRSIYFENNNEEEHISFGSFAICMYYAVQLNAAKAKKLFDATISEWKYRAEYELSTGSLTPDHTEAHFTVSEVQEVVSFLENDVVPALNAETQDILAQYGGKSNFINLYYNNAEFLKFNGISENDFFDSDGETLAHYMNRLKLILQYSLSVNQACDVYVR